MGVSRRMCARRPIKLTAMWALASLTVFPIPSSAQVPAGYELVRITPLKKSLSRPVLNNRGDVIWSEASPPSVSRIMLYSGGIVQRLTDDTHYDVAPSINDHGDYAYLIASDFFGEVDVKWVIGGEATIHDAMNAANAHPRINNAGCIVWNDKFSENGDNQPVFLFDGESVQQITSNRLCYHTPQINNVGQIVYDETDINRLGGPSKIILFEGGVEEALTDDDKARFAPSINDDGEIVWSEADFDGSDGRIMLWQGGTAVAIAEGSVAGPSIGNNGDVTYLRANETRGLNDNWYYRAADKALYQLPHLGLTHGAPTSINNCGELTWLAVKQDSSERIILLVRRIGPSGDFDHDCHVDVTDFLNMQHCYTGPDNGPPDGLLADCTRADFDGDGDVDQDDVAAFHAAVTGPAVAVPGCEAVELCGAGGL